MFFWGLVFGPLSFLFPKRNGWMERLMDGWKNYCLSPMPCLLER
uniref:Uncharacterized protein n=1 Tax=Picea sitchensis TaxID=3332 RepID=A0A6B9XVV4_PICSI|nr:hypothetical protein Q903MT_gene5426 [Picea sitchensis]